MELSFVEVNPGIVWVRPRQSQSIAHDYLRYIEWWLGVIFDIVSCFVGILNA